MQPRFTMTESTDTITFTQTDLPSESFSVLRDLKRRRQLCDVTITVQERSFFAHRVVLAAAIPYFRIMFTSDRIESKARKLDLKIVEADALESLIDFAYCSRLKITSENARSLLFASAFLKMEQVQAACSTFMGKRLSPYNVLDIQSLADSLTCKKLVENCDSYIRRTFDEFSQSAAFVGLKFQYLKELTSRDDLQVTSEEKIYEAVRKWVKSSSAERAAFLPELLRNVRFSQIAPKYLAEHVASDDLIQKSVTCRVLIEEAQNYQLSLKSKSPHLNNRPRLYKGQPESTTACDINSVMYCVCYSHSLGCVVRYCDPKKIKWTTVTTNDQCTDITHVTSVSDHIYVFATDSLKVLNLKTLQWTTHAPCPKSFPGNNVLTHSQKVYCFDTSATKEVWFFDKTQNRWRVESHTSQKRSRGGAVSLGDFIYLHGGLQNESDCFSAQDSVERYDPHTKETTSISPMLNKRYGHSSAADNAKIYVCGGYRVSTLLSSKSEVYDCLLDQWTSIETMGCPRYPFALALDAEKLYAVGGRTPRRKNLTVEIYDPKTNTWAFGDPVFTEDESEEVKGVVIIANTKTVSASKARKLDKPKGVHGPIYRRNSSKA